MINMLQKYSSSKQNKSKTKAKQKQNKSKTKAKQDRNDVGT